MHALRTIGLAALVVMPGCEPFRQRVTGDEIAVSFRTEDPHARFEYFLRHVPGRRGAGHDQYGTICTGSCDTVVHDWSRFQISGDGVARSPDFHLQAGRPVTLRAHTGPAVANVLGIVIAVLGGYTAAFAGFVAVAPEFRRDAGTVALSGLGAVAAGMLLWFLARTTVEADPPGALVQ